MEKRNGEVHIDTEEVRAGSNSHVARYVLIIGTALAIVALTIIWVTGAVST